MGIPKNADWSKIPDYHHIKIPPPEWYLEQIPRKYKEKDTFQKLFPRKQEKSVTPREKFNKRYKKNNNQLYLACVNPADG